MTWLARRTDPKFRSKMLGFGFPQVGPRALNRGTSRSRRDRRFGRGGRKERLSRSTRPVVALRRPANGKVAGSTHAFEVLAVLSSTRMLR